MRATISFETDLDQVEGTMAVLACSEEHNLRAAADLLSNFTVLDGSVLDAITEALRLLDASAGQLRQYQQMMMNFEKAKFETMLPQPSPASASVLPPGLRDGLDKMKSSLDDIQKFDSFLDRVNEEGEENATPQEG
jgi:hypothetical protein